MVAGEVRTLAQRSAEVPRRSKSLISRNVEQVEQGTGLVDRASKTMDELVASVRRVSDIMARSPAASTESRPAASSKSATPCHEWTRPMQQNAALVEESAARAESLKTQAQQLVTTVSVFRVALSPEALRSSHAAALLLHGLPDSAAAAGPSLAGRRRCGPGAPESTSAWAPAR